MSAVEGLSRHRVVTKDGLMHAMVTTFDDAALKMKK
jgi:hypothetical protein